MRTGIDVGKIPFEEAISISVSRDLEPQL